MSNVLLAILHRINQLLHTRTYTVRILTGPDSDGHYDTAEYQYQAASKEDAFAIHHATHGHTPVVNIFKGTTDGH